MDHVTETSSLSTAQTIVAWAIIGAAVTSAAYIIGSLGTSLVLEIKDTLEERKIRKS